MRILHIGKFFPPFHGGIESFVDALSAAQQADGHAVMVLAHAHAASERSTLADGRILWRAPCHGRLLYVPLSPTFGRWLNAAIRTFKPDVIHAHLPNTSAFFLLRNAAASAPIIVHWHADVIDPAAGWLLRRAYPCYRPLESRLLARASAVIATSPPYRDASHALEPFRANTHVVPLGIALPTTDAEPIAHPAGKLQALFIGRDTGYKGLSVLLEAVTGLRGVTLDIVGAAPSPNAPPNVRLHGRVTDEEKNALLSACDVLCLPSINRHEAFGVVLLEAAARGRPVITSDIPGSGAPWVVGELDNGLTTPPGDVDALRDALATLRDDPTRALELGAAGRVNMQAFSIDAIAHRIHQVYLSAG